MDPGADTTGEAFDRMPLKKPRLDVGSEEPLPTPLWADIQPDILGVVLRFLPCFADRVRVRSVCPRWRIAARSQTWLPPPLPLLVLPKFRLSSLTSEKVFTATRSSLMPEEVAPDGYRYVGSYDGWVVSVTQIHSPYFTHIDGELFDPGFFSTKDDKCFLVNAFSHRVVHLPHLCCASYTCAHFSFKILPVINGLGDVRFEINGSYTMSPNKVVLSASPDSGSKYIVAASSDTMDSGNLALWQPGMTSWHVCTGVTLNGPKDIAFYQGKLYVLQRSIYRLFAFVLDDDDHGIVISHVEHCMTEPFPTHPMEQDGFLSCNMVVWRDNLLLVIRYNDTDCLHDWKTIKVDVFALDVNTKPYGLTRIHSFDGDCIFVGSGSSKSFPASLHDGVEGDLIYFVPDLWCPSDRFVYNMRDGRMRPLSDQLLPVEGHMRAHFPMWLFPSE
ncbi:unnamed protein product [Urochloa humidicola]